MPNDLPLEVDCRAVQANLARDEHYLLIDCREQDEWTLVHIDRARLIPMSELAARVAELDPFRNSPIAVHCHHGGRSLRVVSWLRDQGFAQAQSMAGGIDTWATEIDPSLSRY
jgi:adenylyltransferase/sulfurtransferase